MGFLYVSKLARKNYTQLVLLVSLALVLNEAVVHLKGRKKMSRFSVIIPIYRTEKYLKECVDSVLSQSFRDIEVILVDDGSPDGCPAICDEYAAADSRVTVIHKENGGLSDARNAGLLAAIGEYVIFMDSDDYYLSTELLARIDEKATEGPCDAVFFRFRQCIEKTDTLSGTPAPYPETEGKTCGEGLESLSALDMLDASACSKATRRAFLINNNLFFKTGMVCEDIEWYFRYAPLLETIALLDFPAYCYRIREGSISHSLTEKNIRDMYFPIKTYASVIRDGSSESTVALLNYMAYQYYCILGLSRNVLHGDVRRDFFETLSGYRWLTEYSISGKTKKCALLMRLFGIRISRILMGIYIKIK